MARAQDGFHNRLFLDPLYGRHYPADMMAEYSKLFADGPTFIQDGDLDIIAAQTDFLGINFYMRQVVRDEEAPDNLPQTRFMAPEEEHTEKGWEINAPALYDLLNRLYFEYQAPKLYITENGCSFSDGPDEQGVINDVRRLTYLRNHFTVAHRAMQNGVPLAGYFVWSFMDNFEWADGYAQRFGITWVDFETQQRILKNSALWYKQVIAQNGF